MQQKLLSDNVVSPRQTDFPFGEIALDFRK